MWLVPCLAGPGAAWLLEVASPGPNTPTVCTCRFVPLRPGGLQEKRIGEADAPASLQ